jgi:hypothetical protein
MERYIVTAFHGATATTFYAVDTFQPEDEQPAIVRSWSTGLDPNAFWLAQNFCDRHNRTVTVS